MEEPKVQALGIFDVLKLADKDLINKFLLLANAVKIEETSPGIVRVSFELHMNS